MDAVVLYHTLLRASASIEGYGAPSRQTLDNDLRVIAQRFVRSSLQHLTESQQRSTEQWLGEELQRERRKQQFRTPHTIRYCTLARLIDTRPVA